jgi:hypothetical protein
MRIALLAALALLLSGCTPEQASEAGPLKLEWDLQNWDEANWQ